MSLTYFQLCHLCEQTAPLLKGAALASFQALDSRKFVLSFQTKHEVLHLLLCLRTPFLRFHLARETRSLTHTPFTNEILAKLHGSSLDSMDIINEDRIVQMTFKKGSYVYYVVGEFFSKSPNLYLLSEAKEILASLNPVQVQAYQPPAKPVWPARPLVLEEPTDSLQIERQYALLEGKAEFTREKAILQGHVKRRIKSSRQQMEKFKLELAAAEDWAKMQHEAHLLQSNLFRLKRGMKEILVLDWEGEGAEITIRLDPAYTPREEVEIRFQQAKKLRAGIPHVKKRLELAGQKTEWWERQLVVLEGLASMAELALFRKETGLLEKAPHLQNKTKPARKTPLPYHEYTTEAGLKIWVGKRARDNEKLTFSLARGNDWWFHAGGYPGSHVILRISKNQEPDRESLLDAMQLALMHSKAKGKGEAEILISRRKFVSPIGKGHTGKVQISQHKAEWIRIDQERYQKLKLTLHPKSDTQPL